MSNSRWDEEEWLEDARSILAWLQQNESNQTRTLLIRHSHRLHSDDQEELLHMQLTPLGIKMATEFGSRIPDRWNLKVFHSEHSRCEKTTMCIIEGYEKQGRTAENLGPFRDLLGPRVSTSIGPELRELGIDGFVNAWGKGVFPTSQIEPLENYSKRLWKHVTGNMKGAQPGALLLNITHDLVLMSLRRGVLGVEATPSNWTPFLGGFGIVRSGKEWLWYEKETVRDVRGIPGTKRL